MEHEISEIKGLLKKPIILIGLMGAGKTTIGGLLAKELNWPFYDSDDEIVKMAGKSISQIFAEDGEPAFRLLECRTIQKLLLSGPCVIAAGGGAITTPETANEIIGKTLCLWLDAPVDVLVERTRGSDRPLLQHGDPADVLMTLYEKRRAAYMQAHIHVQDIGLTPDEATTRIILQLREYIFMHSTDEEESKHIPHSLCLDVTLGERSYPIFMGSSILSEPDVWLAQDFHGRKAFIITDYNVRAAIADTLQKTIRPFMKSIAVMELPPGEQSKSFDRYQAVMEWLVENNVTRDSVIFAVGGGVVGDLAGFAASTILRGIDFIQIPTTLLSQVDSSVGGKTGINTRLGKNMVGTFYQPRAVVIDLSSLNSLPQREWKAGYAEIVKCSLINDAHFFSWLIENGTKVLAGDPLALLRAIEVSCHMKADIVREDEREQSGKRALLNLGHTFGHALESLSGYNGTILHGEAVSIGLALAARLSEKLGAIDALDVQIIEQHLVACGLPIAIRDVALPKETTAQDILNVMRRDKKANKDGLVFVTLRQLGDAILTEDIAENIVQSIIEESL